MTLTYYDHLAALLEPDALETIKVGTFSYPVSAGATKWLLVGQDLELDSSGRLEIEPSRPLALSGKTLTGLASDSCAVTLDPTLPTYADALATYKARLLAITTSTPMYVPFTGAGTIPLLCGPYGSILLQATCYKSPSLVLRPYGTTLLYHLVNHVDDSTLIRTGTQLYLPLSKAVVSRASLASGTGAIGSLLLFNCPSTWSAVTDPNTYAFRDDFLGGTLDTTTTWTRSVSGGSAVIDSVFPWLKITGDGTYGHNGVKSQASVSRATGRVFQCDVMAPSADGTHPNLDVGFHTGTFATGGPSDFAHAIDFSGGPDLAVFENGTLRGLVGSGFDGNSIYRVRITLQATNTHAKYEIQGGSQYPAIGGSSWTDLTPGTTSSSTTPLYAGVVKESTDAAYVGDVRIYG